MISGKRLIDVTTFMSDVLVQGGAKPMAIYGLTKDKLFMMSSSRATASSSSRTRPGASRRGSSSSRRSSSLVGRPLRGPMGDNMVRTVSPPAEQAGLRRHSPPSASCSSRRSTCSTCWWKKDYEYDGRFHKCILQLPMDLFPLDVIKGNGENSTAGPTPRTRPTALRRARGSSRRPASR
jgi:hypothetical protein